MNADDPLRNPKDPLRKVGPDGERALFQELGRACNGCGHEMVTGAAGNLLLNAIRQGSPTRREAEAKFDELFGRLKAVLLDQHYDGAGNRKNVFPFDQVLNIPLFDARRKSH